MQVPGWRLWGNATLVDYSVRARASIRGTWQPHAQAPDLLQVVLTSGYPGHPEAGAIWNPKRIDFVEWELRIVFNVNTPKLPPPCALHSPYS